MALLSIIVFMFLLMSGSIFLLRYFNIRIEESLPICCTSVVLISFIMGIVGLLKYAVYVLLIIGMVLYFCVIYLTIKSKDIKNFILNIFTPGLIIFIIICLIFLFTTKGKMFSDWDEFTHWGDIVKVMSALDDFGTNSASLSMFKSYPPGMSLFQYILEKINYFISSCQFVEWLTYYAYYILAVVYLLPFTKGFSNKKLLYTIIYIVILICVPFAFFDRVYCRIYIDPFLSFLFAAGLLHILFDDSNNIINSLNLYSILFMLVLAKDAGLMLSIMLILAYVTKEIVANKNSIRKSICYTLFAILSVAFPKMLWSWNIELNNVVPSFNSKIDFNNLWQVLIGNDHSYRREIITKYISTLQKSGLNINFINININYILLFIIIIISLIAIVKKANNRINSIITCIFGIVTCILYAVGLCILYMYKFQQIEALALSSFDRYINIVFMGLFLFICIALLLLLNSKKHSFLYLLCIIVFTVLCCPINQMGDWLSRQTVKGSCRFRSQYDEIVNATTKYAFENSRIFFVSQDSEGLDYYVYKYSIKPNKSCGGYGVGESYYSNYITAEEWMQELIENYDYVALFHLNSYFYSHYYPLFEDSDHIYNNCIYAVDKQWGVLVPCEN